MSRLLIAYIHVTPTADQRTARLVSSQPFPPGRSSHCCSREGRSGAKGHGARDLAVQQGKFVLEQVLTMRAGRGSCLARRAASTRVALASAVVVLALVCGVRGEVPRVETRSPANGALNVGVGLDALELAYSVDVEAAHGVVTLHLEGAASAAAEVSCAPLSIRNPVRPPAAF